MDKSLIKIDGIIFDLDGTLIDYEMLSHKALSVAINKEC
jgi:phosphoglycolate phosphatase-like HAD superfamily hydrolase